MEYRYIVSKEEMEQYDKNTIEYFGMPSAVLMERAALAIAEEVEKRFAKDAKVLIAAGVGNNGGDGIAAGRILMLHGYRVEFCLIGERKKCSREMDRQLTIIEKYECPLQSKIEKKEYDIIVDALFGIGLSRNAEGIYEEAIQAINSMKGFVCAADIPSGINADTGEVMGAAVKADLTVTFGYKKRGHILYPGSSYAGSVLCRDIGITQESFRGRRPKVFSYNGPPDSVLPVRNGGGNKGTFGKVLVIAGSRNMSGACELCAGSAYRIGAGIVKVATAVENREIIQKNLPEALLMTYESEEGKDWKKVQEQLKEAVEWSDVIVAGPGIGKGRVAYNMLLQALRQGLNKQEKKMVIDADGLNLIAESEELQELIKNAGKEAGSRIILTPHVGEFARLYGCTAGEAKKEIIDRTKQLALRYGCIVVCKDARTVVSSAFREEIYLNSSGNDGMATAGSGDVLAGIIGGLLAQGMDAFDAAAAGVYIHGKAGDAAADRMGKHAVMAGDLTEQLKYIRLWKSGGLR